MGQGIVQLPQLASNPQQVIAGVKDFVQKLRTLVTDRDLKALREVDYDLYRLVNPGENLSDWDRARLTMHVALKYATLIEGAVQLTKLVSAVGAKTAGKIQALARGAAEDIEKGQVPKASSPHSQPEPLPKSGETPPDGETPLAGHAKPYPGTLGRRFTGDLNELTQDMRKLDPGFKGFKGGVDLPEGVEARYNSATKTIEFRRPLNQLSRGVVAEEVRHFLDEARLGVTEENIIKEFEAETGMKASNNPRNLYNWHHRRVFTRMIQDVESGRDPIMNKILNPGDLDSLHQTYQGAFGRKPPDWLSRQKFDNPYRSGQPKKP
jgi:hypothetical protein